MTYDNTNSGALFKNKRHEHATQPGYTGKINVNGEEFYLSAWIKETKAGEKFFSLRVKPKDEVQPKQSAPVYEDSADIPF